MQGVSSFYQKNLEAGAVHVCLDRFKDLIQDLSEENIVKMSYTGNLWFT